MRFAVVMFFAAATFILVPEVCGQDARRDAKAIALIKNIQISHLDSRLRAQGFLQWLRGVVGNSQKIDWEVNDCGEQDGSGRQKDFPICVQAHTFTSDHVEVSIMVMVGSHMRGIVGKPAVWGIWVVTEHDGSKLLDTLSELRQELLLIKRRKSGHSQNIGMVK